MVNNDELINVRNLTDSPVVYKSYDGHRREFLGGQSFNIPAEELRQLGYSTGGLNLLRNYLHVDNLELAREFGVTEDSYENEYSWTLKDVDRLLVKGDMDELQDALDFAPQGIIDTILGRAIETKLNNVEKRKAISQATGANIDAMIANVESANSTSDVQEETQPKRRRKAKKAEPAQSKRRTAAKKTAN